jgi:pimeloyl-ACP methyl ester carboxylesterase
VLVHGMGEDGRTWAPAVEALRDVARVVVYDRRGYGESPIPEPYEGTTAVEQGEDLAAVVEGRGIAPAVLCGQDVGALAVLYLLTAKPRLARAAVLVAPPVYAFVGGAADVLTAERIAIGEKLHDAGPRAAMESWLGRPAPDVDPRAFWADYAGIASLPLSRRELRRVTTPVVVLPGARPEPHDALAATALAATLGAAREEPGGDPVPAIRGLLSG